MPVRPEMRGLYPKEWRRISLEIRQYRAGWQCEMVTGGVQCGARQGEPHPLTGSKVVLAIAHLDHDPTHNEPYNLKALCQRCHVCYDAKHHAMNAAITRRKRAKA